MDSGLGASLRFAALQNDGCWCGEAVLQLTETQRAVQQLAREFAKKEIAPHAAQWDREARFPKEAVQRMADVGLLGLSAPEKFGGSAADSVALALAVEEIACADASCALVLSMANSLSILTMLRYGTPAQQAQYTRSSRAAQRSRALR